MSGAPGRACSGPSGVTAELMKALNESGPFIPLIQPGNNIAAKTSVTGIVYNAVWTIDIASLGSK